MLAGRGQLLVSHEAIMIGYSVGYPQSPIRVPRLATTPPWRRTRAPTLAPDPDHGDHPDGRQQRRHHLHHGPDDRDAADGHWFPNTVAGGASVSISGGVVTVRFTGTSSYMIHNNIRYSCLSSGGCEIVNRRVTRGSIRARAESGGSLIAEGGGRLDHPLDRHGNRPSTTMRPPPPR